MAAGALLAAALCLPDPASVLAAQEAPEPAVLTDGSGTWLLEVTAREVGTLRVPVRFQVDAGGRIFAASRRGSLGEQVGRARALAAALLAPRTYAGGALMTIHVDRTSVRGDTLRFEGVMATPLWGRRPVSARVVDGTLTGEVLHAGDGSLLARIAGSPFSGPMPLRDYAGLAETIRRETLARIYDPSLLERREWRAFHRDLERRLERVQDDADLVMAFALAARRIGLSHYFLAGEGVGADPRAVDGERSVDFEASGAYARITVRHFSANAAEVRTAFERLAASGARTLVLDLRGNRGGDLSSMQVAAHLFPAAQPAGYFAGAGWYRARRAPPTPEDAQTFPVLSSPDRTTLLEAIRAHGGARGVVNPEAPVFTGPVFVLIDAATASAAEPLAELLKENGRATLVGEATAGAMLSSEIVPLADGLVLGLPTADYFTARGRRLEGSGVAPDVRVPSARALDVALELAIR